MQLQTQQNVVIELGLTSGVVYDDPYNNIDIDVVFTTSDESVLRVPAFWAGGQAWRVRFSGAQLGTYSYECLCSNRDDPGLQQCSAIEVLPYTGDNPPLPTAAFGWRRTGATSSKRTARPSSGWETPGGWACPPALIGPEASKPSPPTG